MKKSMRTMKALKVVVTLAALVAALATTGCSGNALVGPETGTQAPEQSVASGSNDEANSARRVGDRIVKPEQIVSDELTP